MFSRPVSAPTSPTPASAHPTCAKEYEERCYKDTSLPLVDSPRPLQPHLYEQAAKVYLLMRRRQESQAVVARGITGSGKVIKPPPASHTDSPAVCTLEERKPYRRPDPGLEYGPQLVWQCENPYEPECITARPLPRTALYRPRPHRLRQGPYLWPRQVSPQQTLSRGADIPRLLPAAGWVSV
ncbi:hypothetical protein NP233_g12197 [Leucocoprinus birnbaumii]|uniref:Uncharacterized protein n=1 Tax=Leucocoprinus birnbaumii TaxID=56174 RepID=A0AAD5VFJ3_9AGAR|nr:hypothetical protein NP233_g12197 [Leucocoprinus birnbaumii]